MELATKEQMLEYLIEVAKAYNSTNRAEVSGACKYFLEGTEGCAVGRRIKDKELCMKMDCNGESMVSSDTTYNMLPDELKIYSKGFLRSLQRLHDDTENWNATGLSEFGAKTVEQIKEKITIGTYDNVTA